MYVTILRVPTQCSCKTLTRGSARPAALLRQVNLQGSILRSDLQDDREPRPTKLLRPNAQVTAFGLKPWAILFYHFMAGFTICKDSIAP